VSRGGRPATIQPIAVKTLALGWLVQWLGHEFDNSVLKEAAALAWLAIELRTLFMQPFAVFVNLR